LCWLFLDLMGTQCVPSRQSPLRAHRPSSAQRRRPPELIHEAASRDYFFGFFTCARSLAAAALSALVLTDHFASYNATAPGLGAAAATPPHA
jgi:hypothetical protein